jgi:putative FmdB family regulatory protein
MLLHDYKCQNEICGKVFEVDHKFYEKPEVKCPLCNTHSNKMIGSAGFLLKGEGWENKNRVRSRKH